MNVDNVLGDCRGFFSMICDRLAGLSIDVIRTPVSHLCYRVATLGEYAPIRDRLMASGHSYVEREFNGRPITLLMLRQPLTLSREATVSLIELPAPKPSHAYPTGLEHVGFVVGADLPAFRARHAHVLTGEKDRGPHCQPPFITFDNGKTAKFYDRPLAEVVQLEGWRFTPVGAS
jgi:predicted metalloenzyme YecM